MPTSKAARAAQRPNKKQACARSASSSHHSKLAHVTNNLEHMSSAPHSVAVTPSPGLEQPEPEAQSGAPGLETAVLLDTSISTCPAPTRLPPAGVSPEASSAALPELDPGLLGVPATSPGLEDEPLPPAEPSSLLLVPPLTPSPEATAVVTPHPVRAPAAALMQVDKIDRVASPDLEAARTRPTSPYPRRVYRTWRRRPVPSSQVSQAKQSRRAAKTVAKWKQYSRDVKRRITASRVRNAEIGEASNLMEYLIAIVGPVTRTEDSPMWRSIVVCALITAGSVAVAMLYEHPMAQSVAGWMMGLAWDSLWHAIISPQQAEDNARRAWMADVTELMGGLEIDFDLEVPAESSMSEHAVYGDMAFNYDTSRPWYPWLYRIDFVKPDAKWGTTFEDTAASLPGAVVHENFNATAVSWDAGDGRDGRDFRLLSFTWRESARDSASPLLVTTHTVTRTQIQAALERMVRRPNNAWWALDTLRPLLTATPTKLRRSSIWMDAARTAVKVANIFQAQYRDIVRFAVAVHELADYEHAHELPFADGLCLTHAFDDHFLRPPRFYSPPSLAPPSPSWVLQATEYIHAYLDTETGEYEYVQDMALVLAVDEHRKALEKLNGGRVKIAKTE